MKNADIAKAMTTQTGIPQWTSSEETFPGRHPQSLTAASASALPRLN